VYTNENKPLIIAKAKVIIDFMQYISQYLSLFCECHKNGFTIVRYAIS